MYFGTTPRAGIPYRPTPPVHRHLAGSQSAALAAPGRPPHRMSPTATDAPSSAFRSASAASPAQPPIGSPNMSSTQPSAGPRPARTLLRCMRRHDAHVDSPNRGRASTFRSIQNTTYERTGNQLGGAQRGVELWCRRGWRRPSASPPFPSRRRRSAAIPAGTPGGQPVAPASRRRRGPPIAGSHSVGLSAPHGLRP